MPAYKFTGLPAGRSVTVRKASDSSSAGTGTVDSNGVLSLTLPAGDYVVTTTDYRGRTVTAREELAVTNPDTGLPSDVVTLSGTVVGSPPVAKPSGDGRAGVWEYTHNDTTGYLYHLLAGTSFAAPSALIALGMDNGNGTGLLIANKKQGKGLVIDQRATVDSATAYAFHATQRSTSAPLVRLEQNASGVAPALQLLAFNASDSTPPTAAQDLLYLGDPSGQAMVVKAATGQLETRRSIVMQDKDGSTASYLEVTDNNGVATTARTYTRVKKTGVDWFSYAGSASTWWPFALDTAGSRLRIRAGASVATVGGTPTMANVIEVQSAKLGFFAATPVAKPTGVAVTAEAIHAALVSLGLIAA